jgi:hypothetical protein
MERPRLVIKPTPSWTRLLLTSFDEELMKAQLPPASSPQMHPKAAQTLCEGLSLWLGRPLSIVLCADAERTSCVLGLCDGFGIGHSMVHYEVEVVDPRRRRRGMGPFADLRRLDLRLRGIH